ncbi:hypothetical protein K457DRAFT_143644 [Linnemannia elongata AG-77]|uniref:Uncharacterized protein n=1 Tax=Linnemannia elongata AG-77 TaxID=1314771 RepID=A0A197JGF6_9FUNG|nr:hypothetical protein K457DRAFT_143644 [Linnemannia elongata AG-77]
MSKYRICSSCNKKKSAERYESDNGICRRCTQSMPKDSREVNVKDLLIALERINVTLSLLVTQKAF